MAEQCRPSSGYRPAHRPHTIKAPDQPVGPSLKTHNERDILPTRARSLCALWSPRSRHLPTTACLRRSQPVAVGPSLDDVGVEGRPVDHRGDKDWT
jgi:hypothetical protein